jgi:hypothetical protein
MSPSPNGNGRPPEPIQFALDGRRTLLTATDSYDTDDELALWRCRIRDAVETPIHIPKEETSGTD